jgi:hypothetical protein
MLLLVLLLVELAELACQLNKRCVCANSWGLHTLGSFVMFATSDSCTLLATSSTSRIPATVTFQPFV